MKNNKNFLLNPHQVITDKGITIFSDKTFKSEFIDSTFVAITTIDNIVK